MESTALWVFGYGSLCWHPGFDYHNAVTGFIRGYSRRFWQGNTTHRGTEHEPGRVATLVNDKEGTVWGRAFQVSGEAALPYLNQRECQLGGYKTQIATFHPRNAADDTRMAPFPAVLYIATPCNALWLGEAPEADIAGQIARSSGPSGHNVEYLFRLADFMREHVPEAEDNHLFVLEDLVRSYIEKQKLCLRKLMGERASPTPAEHRPQQPDPEAPELRRDSFEFTSRVPPKKLRCLNM